MVRQSLPEVDLDAFRRLVDGGEGKEEGESPRKLSSTPLRMCRYAGGADGVAFGEFPFLGGVGYLRLVSHQVKTLPTQTRLWRFLRQRSTFSNLSICYFCTRHLRSSRPASPHRPLAPLHPASPFLGPGAHTDTTFLTVIPCASVPGLEILNPATKRWVRPEAARSCRPGDSDVMLLAGELLQVFGRDRYQAAVHRVVRPAGATEPRVSTPLLLRGAGGVTVRDSMLPPAVTSRFEEHSLHAARRVEGVRPMTAGAAAAAGAAAEEVPPDEADGGGARKLTMTDLWRALQFRGGASSTDASGGGGGAEREPESGGLPRACSVDAPSSLSSPPPPPPHLPPLAQAQTEEQIRKCFEPFARDGVTVLSVDPLLVRLHGFASEEECNMIIAQGLGTLEESTTWGGADAQAETDGTRSSTTTWLADESLAPLLATLTERVSGMSGLPSTFMEKWQVRIV